MIGDVLEVGLNGEPLSAVEDGELDFALAGDGILNDARGDDGGTRGGAILIDEEDAFGVEDEVDGDLEIDGAGWNFFSREGDLRRRNVFCRRGCDVGFGANLLELGLNVFAPRRASLSDKKRSLTSLKVPAKNVASKKAILRFCNSRRNLSLACLTGTASSLSKATANALGFCLV